MSLSGVDLYITFSSITLRPLPLLDHCEQTLRHHSEASLRLPLSGSIHLNDKHCLISGSSHRLVTVLGWWLESDLAISWRRIKKRDFSCECLYWQKFILKVYFYVHFCSDTAEIRLILHFLWVQQQEQDLSSCDRHWDNHCFLEAVPAASPVLTYHVMGYIGLHKSVCLYTYTQAGVSVCCAKAVLQPVIPEKAFTFVLLWICCVVILQMCPVIITEL